MTLSGSTARWAAWLALAGLAGLLALLVGADPAHALIADPSSPAGGTTRSWVEPIGGGSDSSIDAGTNLGDLIRSITQPLVYTIAGLAGIGTLLKRDMPGALTLVALAIVIGLFVFEAGGDALAGLTNALADALGA